MSHRGPRKQPFPRVNGKSSNYPQHNRDNRNTRPRVVTAPSWSNVYDMLQDGEVKVGGARHFVSIRAKFPLSKYPEWVLEAAFAKAREIEDGIRVVEEPLGPDANYFELRDDMLQIAYYNVRDIADLIMKLVEVES